MNSNLTLENIKIGDLIFTCRTQGNPSKSAIILLHGFPESSHMWIHLMEHLSQSGYYCIAPNLRGYSVGARPKKLKEYHISKLVLDIINLAEEKGIDSFHLIGHDWGSVIGWLLTNEYPDRIKSWTSLSVPHLQAFITAITTDKIQINMSKYIRFFQLPWLPELKLKKNDLAVLRKLWKHSEKEEIEDYVFLFKGKRAMTAALNYYRANYNFFKRGANTKNLGDIYAPTLLIWGKKDMAIGPKSIELGHEYMKGPYTFIPLDAGHWLIQTKYEEIKEAIMLHISGNDS